MIDGQFLQNVEGAGGRLSQLKVDRSRVSSTYHSERGTMANNLDISLDSDCRLILGLLVHSIDLQSHRPPWPSFPDLVGE